MCIAAQHWLHLAPALMLCIQLLTAPGWIMTQVVIKTCSFQGLRLAPSPSKPCEAFTHSFIHSFIHSFAGRLDESRSSAQSY